MKKSIFTLVLVSILAFAFSFGFVGCKKEGATDEQKVEDTKAPEGDAAADKKDEAAGEKKEEAAK